VIKIKGPKNIQIQKITETRIYLKQKTFSDNLFSNKGRKFSDKGQTMNSSNVMDKIIKQSWQ